MITTYTTAEAAEVLHITAQTVITYINNGTLRASKVGKGYIIPAAALEDFLRAREVKPLKDAGQDAGQNTEQAGEPEEVKE